MAEVIRTVDGFVIRTVDDEAIRIVDVSTTPTCPDKIDCPPADIFTNYSSESLDLFEFHSVAYGANGCIGRCTSQISQEDADLCALRQLADCVIPEEPCFGNDPQTCTTSCPDGSSSYSFTTPANMFLYTTQAEADAEALAYACEQAEINRFCLTSESLLLRGCCQGAVIDELITVTNDPGDLVYAVSSGSLPTGLALNGASIQGTASAAGNYPVSLTVQDPQGNFSSFDFTISVIWISDTALPDYTVGNAYLHQMNVQGGTGPYLWALSGTLPAGMTFSDSGLLSGTPTATGDALLTFQVTDTASGTTCQKQLQLEGTSAPLPHLTAMIPAYSEDSEIVGCSFVGDPATDSGIISRRAPDSQTGSELLNLLPTGGATSGSAWCPVNDKFYHGTWQHDLGGGDIGMVVVYDPITSTTEIIGGFTPTTTAQTAQRAVWISTTSRMWVMCSIGLNRVFAIIDPADNSYTFLSDANLLGILDLTVVGGELWVTKNLSGGRVFRIDVTTQIATLVLNEATFEAWKGGAVTGWSVAAIEYVQSVGEVWVVVVFNEGFGADSRVLRLNAVTGAIIDYVSPSPGVYIQPPSSMYYVQPFDRLVLAYSGINSLNPADYTQVIVSPTDAMSARKGCFCTNINKVGLPVLSGSVYTINFYTAAQLGA